MKIVKDVLRLLCLTAAWISLWLCGNTIGLLATIIETSHGDHWSQGLVMAYLMPSIFIACTGTLGVLFAWLGVARWKP
jgi:hypothetical protein